MTPTDFLLNCQITPPIQVWFRHGRCVPRFICQGCKTPITNLGMAGLAFGTWDDADAGQQQVALLLCKSKTCLNNPLIELWLWAELRHGITHCLQNAGLQTPRAFIQLYRDTLEFDTLG